MHQVLDPIDDHQIAIVGKIAGIARVKPSIDDGTLGFVLVFQVSLKKTGPPG